jgi:hypothetical protein
MLVLRDQDFPGWQAYVDGVRAPLCRADYLFRAVPLAPGEHLVEFRYRPLSFGIGLSLLWGAMVVAGVLLAWPRRGRIRVRADPVALVGWTLLFSLAAVLAGFAPWPPRG